MSHSDAHSETHSMPSGKSIKSLKSEKIENPEDAECLCEANLFYKKYKTQLEELLSHPSFINKYRDDVHVTLKDKISSYEGERSSTFRKDKHGSREGIHSKSAKSFISEPSDDDKKAAKSTDQIQLRQKKDQKRSTKDVSKVGSQISRTDSQKLLDDSQAITSKDEDLDASLKEKHEKHVDLYASALGQKLHQIFGEGEGESEAHTERGYFIFDRFVDRSRGSQSTVYKMSSASASAEGEYFSLPSQEEEQEWMSESMRQALEYLRRHKIGELFKFLGAHLVAANPCNPIDFLITLLENCLSYRQGYCDPPLLYLPKHIESLVHSMDPMRTGLIDINQYHTGMFTLGIRCYNMFPETVKNNMVMKHTFLEEAFNQLKSQLNEIIQSTATPITVTTFSAATYFSGQGETEG